MTAVSAVVGALGLTGAVLLATAPMTAPKANAQVVRADPTDQVEPTDPTITDPGGLDESPEPEPTVTVTITESPDPTVTRTRTVTPKPTKTAKPTAKPTATKTAPVVPPPAPTYENTPSSLPVIPPTPPVDTPLTPAETPAPDPMLSLALATPTPTPTQSETEALDAMSFDDPTPDSVPIEIRNATPEYDQLTLSRKLAIPGVLLAVLVMLGVLIFEGRVRRLAHAAAIRKAGPRTPGRHRGDGFPVGLPMPGYPVYHEGAAYAPIISFVPVQGYPGMPGSGPSAPLGYGNPQDPHAYDPQAYGAVFDQGPVGHARPGPIALPAGMSGPADPWPRDGVQEPPAGGGDMAVAGTAAFPAVGETKEPQGATGPWTPAPEGTAKPDATLQAPLPMPGTTVQDAKPRSGLLSRFSRKNKS
ncbi:hypothetical protein ACFFWE_20995 [Sphaerisporangium melleum]|uniref:hypothetical protein n=1 Tax=Sphaerisporangium melleum TaxID=321316 RepID=UPI0019508871|nr:hypothetical protein [Sphaerisporangium melleum]